MQRHSRNRQKLLRQRAIALRAGATASEAPLWRALSAAGLSRRFRRQAPLLGRFIADLVAPSARLVVEIDGPYHARRMAADARRDRALERAGYRVLRLQSELVLEDSVEAMRRVRAALGSPP